MRDDANSARQSQLFMHDTSWSRVGLPLAAGLLVLAPLVRRWTGRATVLVYLTCSTSTRSTATGPSSAS